MYLNFIIILKKKFLIFSQASRLTSRSSGKTKIVRYSYVRIEVCKWFVKNQAVNKSRLSFQPEGVIAEVCNILVEVCNISADVYNISAEVYNIYPANKITFQTFHHK